MNTYRLIYSEIAIGLIILSVILLWLVHKIIEGKFDNEFTKFK
jgi:hypothetical protein